ncbi:hypothetical protein GCM10007049_01040 [Echinicola pacifica]|uniref:Sugar phosphate isomerase/epimerase n=1 Tax=Echinicola pacifica TaxID=346377 RepID=A0A918UIW8_9BACT|nr:sugar phosphate isomerase/epimerase [Echinicola pacifica]GGZ13072.1 hypothetical protein GCM10007049_01040 [Echinicola pacifica]
MKLKLIYPRWGNDHIPWKKFLKEVKEAGFHGVEIGIPQSKTERDRVLGLIKDLGLDFIAQHWETQSSNFHEHLNSYKHHLIRLAECQPLLINSHTGKDYFSPEYNLQLIDIGHEIEIRTGVPITHETHRSRFLYAAHMGQTYLKGHDSLKLTTDLSHWCCVAESLLEDQPEAVEQAILHTYHLHARVGSSQTAQVIDPRDPRYATELEQFKSWWKSILTNAWNANREWMTVSPEYGPAPYALHSPFSDLPMGDQWEINLFISDEVKKIHQEISDTKNHFYPENS